MGNSIVPALLAMFTLLGGAAGQTETGERRTIVDTDFVAQAISRGAIIWDVRAEEDYNLSHIPGAVNIGDIQMRLRDKQTLDYIPAGELEKILDEAGIDLYKEIVVYGAKAGPAAYFGHVTLRYLGGRRAYIYHGGIDDWKTAGKGVSTQKTILPAIPVPMDLDRSIIVSTHEVLAKLRDPNVQFLDVRTPAEYSGQEVRVARGGHIPGAISIPYENNWIDPETPRKLKLGLVSNKDGMNLKSMDELRTLYAKLSPSKETIVYCQSGIRASMTAVILQALGFENVRVYDSSWHGYANTPDAPVEK